MPLCSNSFQRFVANRIWATQGTDAGQGDNVKRRIFLYNFCTNTNRFLCLCHILARDICIFGLLFNRETLGRHLPPLQVDPYSSFSFSSYSFSLPGFLVLSISELLFQPSVCHIQPSFEVFLPQPFNSIFIPPVSSCPGRTAQIKDSKLLAEVIPKLGLFAPLLSLKGPQGFCLSFCVSCFS